MGILSTRKVGMLLALFWMGTLCYFWLPDHIPDFLDLRTKSTVKSKLDVLPKIHKLNHLPLQVNVKQLNISAGPDALDIVHVCITSDGKTLGGMIALINSILTNTKHHVKFHLVTDDDNADHLGLWIQTSSLKGIDYEVKTFPVSWVTGKIKIRGGRQELGSPLNYARYYLPRLFPDLKERIVFIDDDCIVQGDIMELYKIPIKEGDLAAFSEDCKGMNKRLSRLSNVYAEFLDFKNKHVQEKNIRPGACSFNTGVFVTDLASWHRENITGQLEYWMELNTREEVYGNERGGGGSQPPMMLVFYDRYTPIESLWHVRFLGWTSGTSYSKSFISHAKLLHWNGKFKPWGRVAQHSDVWDKYFVPDPSGKFRPVRRGRGLQA
ncbi:glycosyltransferase 8 domain-containing protein 1-like [Plakobranchus ocellatus]|uniref:Glycosyltransferase 8 domain-containing protein 1-like n=1 Tax=Plakobranchus ocellatus TaxID=259542 RepID=A0AAV4AXW5_9GAST|nr:glycosyltransferase 8 domain-containing protein 1-like [Plakobranchus ocellatus]